MRINRRDLVIQSSAWAASVTALPRQTSASEALEKKERTSTTSPVTGLINEVGDELLRTSSTADRQVKLIDDCYERMLAQTKRALKKSTLSDVDRKALETFRKKILKGHARLKEAENSTTFDRSVRKWVKQAKKNAKAYQKTKIKNVKTTERLAARKHLNTARKALDGGTSRYLKELNRMTDSFGDEINANSVRKINSREKLKKLAKATAQLEESKAAAQSNVPGSIRKKIDSLKAKPDAEK